MSKVPIWKIALRDRASDVASRSMGASARLALRDLLWQAGCPVSLMTIHLWPRAWQGAAYLWARRTLDGDAVVRPYHVRIAMEEEARRARGA